MAFNSQGFNPRFGPDNGAFSHPVAGGAGYAGMQTPYMNYAYPGYPGSMYTQPVMTPSGMMAQTGAHPGMVGGLNGPRPVMTPHMNRPQAPYPVIHPDTPAAQMTNSTGGVGCEPGYNYFFPAEHTKIHLLKTGATPPWQLPPGSHIEFFAAHVPCGTTLGELMKGFGATNPNPQLNNIYEVLPAGNGRWYKGMQFCGEVAADMGKSIKSLGWDSSRNGLPGGSPVVYLYITKD